MGGKTLEFRAPVADCQITLASLSGLSQHLPILEPDLNLTRSQTRYFFRKSLALGGIGMRLSGELAHQKAGLIMIETLRESASRLVVPGTERVLEGSYRKRFIRFFSDLGLSDGSSHSDCKEALRFSPVGFCSSLSSAD